MTEKAIKAAAVAIVQKAGFAPAEIGAQWSISYAEAAIAAYMAEIGKDDGLAERLLTMADEYDAAAKMLPSPAKGEHEQSAGDLRAAAARIAALQAERDDLAARIAGQDVVWAPREPTEEMSAAGWKKANELGANALGIITDTTACATYRAMLAARPKEPTNYPKTSDALQHGGSAGGAPKEPSDG